jgi:16S rRNA (cytosine967-C5)-methyltransferase
MHPHSLIEFATELLHQVLQFDAPADRIVSDFFRANRHLGPRERHSLAETTYNVLRRRLLYQHLAQSGSGEQTRRLVLLGWQGNSGFLKAALTDGEQPWLEQVQKVDLASLPDKLKHNLPEWLAGALQAQLGEAFWPLIDALQEPAPLDVRVNALKMKRDEALASLNAASLPCTATPHSPWGLRFEGKPARCSMPARSRSRTRAARCWPC